MLSDGTFATPYAFDVCIKKLLNFLLLRVSQKRFIQEIFAVTGCYALVNMCHILHNFEKAKLDQFVMIQSPIFEIQLWHSKANRT